MLIDSTSCDKLSYSLANLLGMSNIKFKTLVLVSKDMLIEQLENKIDSSNVTVEFMLHHISRRLESHHINFGASNLRSLLLSDNDLTRFFRCHQIYFFESGQSVAFKVDGVCIDLNRFHSCEAFNLKSRLNNDEGGSDTCINGFALADSIQNNNYFGYYADAPEILRMMDSLFPDRKLLSDYKARSSAYLISYFLDIDHIFIDDYGSNDKGEILHGLLDCYINRLDIYFRGEIQIKNDRYNLILRTPDDYSISEDSCSFVRLDDVEY